MSRRGFGEGASLRSGVGRLTARGGAGGDGLRDVALGVAAALGQAPLGLWPVALAAYALILRRMAGAPTARAAFLRGWGAGLGHFGVALVWIVQPFLVDPWRHAWMAPFALAGMGLGLGLFWAVAAGLGRRLGGGAIPVALAWSAAELLRGHVFTGFPWALPGHIWTGTPLVQTASLTGAYGMTALMLLALAAPQGVGRRGPMPGAALGPALGPVLPGLLVPGLVLLLAGGWSWHRLALPEPAPRAGVVRVVQPAIPQSLKWNPDEARANFDTLLALTARPGGPALTVWPETAVPYLVTPGEGAAARISAAAGGRPVAAGYQRDAGARVWNSLGVIGPGGRIAQIYDKVHLVPFGEYIPWGDLAYRLLGLRAFAAQEGAGYTAGEGRRLLDLGPELGPELGPDLAPDLGPDLGRAAPLICYESIFAGEVATDPRADWILLVTNDAWFGTLTGPWQHFDQARLRAIEQGLPLVRAANTGVSAVVDARGRIAAAADGRPAVLGMGAQGVIDAALPGALPAPPYARLGDAPLAGLLLAGLCLAAIRGLRRRGA